MTLPVPIQSWTEIAVPFFTFVPAGLDWSWILPIRRLFAVFFPSVASPSASPFDSRSFFAAKTVRPLRFGTVSLCGSRRITAATAATTRGTASGTHRATQGFWRNTAGRVTTDESDPGTVVVTWKRRSTGLPTQICFLGRARNAVPARFPGAAVTTGSAKSNRQALSESSAENANWLGALARLRTATAKLPRHRPRAYSGRNSASNSWYGAIVAVIVAKPASVSCAFDAAATRSDQARASASGVRGG